MAFLTVHCHRYPCNKDRLGLSDKAAHQISCCNNNDHYPYGLHKTLISLTTSLIPSRKPLINFAATQISVIKKHPVKQVLINCVSGSANPMVSINNYQLAHDLAMGFVTLVGSFSSFTFLQELTKQGVFSKTISRKLVHISGGLIFMLFWPLFSDGFMGRYIVALPTILTTLRMLVIGSGIIKDDDVVKTITRDNDPRELLRGPFYYSLTITLATICVWRASPLAPIIIANLCAGDGFADLIGRKFGTKKLPYNSNKSYVGSFSMLVFAFIFSIGYEYYFSSFGYYRINMQLLTTTLLISLVTTFLESLPLNTIVDDNLIVPLASFILGRILL